MLTRRGFFGGVAATLLPTILPARRKAVDLTTFTGRPGHCRYDLDRVVPTDPADADAASGRMPPFDSLDWSALNRGGWRTLPRAEPIPAIDSDCPECDGTGFAGGVCATECGECFGTGRQCKACYGLGAVPPPGVPVCRRCRGNAVGVFPAIAHVGGQYFDSRLYEKVTALGGEYTVQTRVLAGPRVDQVLLFRFDGGAGLLMPMAVEQSRERIREAVGYPVG
jgi:hypothetical protein